MGDQFVGLFECGFVEQELDALPGRHFAFLVLLFAASLAAAVFGQVVALLQFSQFLFEVHGGRIIAGCAGPGITWRLMMDLYRAGRSPARRAGRPSSIELRLLHAGTEWLVLIFPAIPENYGGCLIAASLFGEDSHDQSLFLDGQFLHDDLLEGQIYDDELRFGSG